MGTLITSLHGRGRATHWSSLDPFMIVTALVLIGFGLVTIWSADNLRPLSEGGPVIRQTLFVVIGLPMAVASALIDYRYVKTFAWAIYLATTALLVAVLLKGTTITGSTRWFELGPASIQPSELAKLGVIIALAAFVADRGDEMKRLTNFILGGLVVGIPALLVFRQPDLGTTGVFAFVWLAIMISSRTRLLYIVATLLGSVPGAYIGWRFLMQDYMRERLLISYQPERDPLGDGFNIIQAQVSIGSGGWLGHGLAGGSQSQYDLLRVRLTDFAFAHAMGMFGFVGALALFLTFAILLWRTMRVASEARDGFGQLLAIGVTAMIFFQAFVNIGMNIGLMPVTGIPLPFVSLGGSSLWTLLASLGLLQSVRLHQQRLGFQRE